VEELVAGAAEGIGDDERAEPRLPCHDPLDVNDRRLYERSGVGIEHPEREAEMLGVGVMAKRERPVAIEPVGADVFPGEKYPRAVVLEELLPPAPDGRVEDEVGRTVEVETPPRREEPGEEIVPRIEAVPEADEADADTRTISGERGGRGRQGG
jgi:hypothetical protein